MTRVTTAGDASPAPSARREPLQQPDHPHVVLVRRVVVLGRLVLLLRRLEHEGDAAAPAVLEQPAERSSILRKLSLNDRTQAVIYALRRGWIETPEGQVQSTGPRSDEDDA